MSNSEETMDQLFTYEHNARRWELIVRIFYSIAIAIVIAHSAPLWREFSDLL